MTNLPSGNVRTHPMTGTPDGYEAELRAALNRLDRERISSFARPGQRKAAIDRFVATALAELEKVLGAQRAENAALRVNLKADRTTITGLRADLAAAGELNRTLNRQAAKDAKTITDLRKQVTELTADLDEAARIIAGHVWTVDALRDELTETRASLSAQAAMARDPLTEAVEANARILAQRVRPDATPEVTLEAPSPPLPRRTPAKRTTMRKDAS